MQGFIQLQNMITALENTSSTTQKKQILTEFLQERDVADLVRYTYDPFKKFHVSSKNIKKLRTAVKPKNSYAMNVEGFMQMLDDLSAGTLSGHNAASEILGWIHDLPDQFDEDIIYRIIDKDLKCRANVSLINKACPDLIQEFKVALAETYKPEKDVIGEDWLVSRKLDGCRCICIHKDGEVHFYSRQGHEFLTLGNLSKEIKEFAEYNGIDEFVLDGELCLVTFDRQMNEVEDFQGIMKQIRKKNHTIDHPQYKIFDILSVEAFMEGVSDDTLSERIQTMEDMLAERDWEMIQLLEQLPCTEENFADMQKRVEKEGWEGLIVRKDTIYKGKRSRDMLKVKKFFDAEYVVTDIEEGTMNIVEDGREKTIKGISAVYIDHKGHQVRVGSGFSVDQRQEFLKDPSKIVGKTITVQFFEETTNQDGGISLRFPTFKVLHGEKRNT